MAQCMIETTIFVARRALLSLKTTALKNITFQDMRDTLCNTGWKAWHMSTLIPSAGAAQGRILYRPTMGDTRAKSLNNGMRSNTGVVELAGTICIYIYIYLYLFIYLFMYIYRRDLPRGSRVALLP